jgi:murein DD-endopeptidase MepM/ murein hydrolase activator NlpD
MANKIVFEVIVSDGGTAKLVTKGIDSVGVAADNTRKKVKGASAAQDEFNYKLNQGATGVSSAARSFSKLNQTIGNGPNGLVGAYATLAANAFAVGAAFTVLRSAAQAEQVMKGLEVQGARTGQALTVTAKKVQELSGYTLSLADAMQATAQASAAGFDTKTIERLTKAATDASAALGRNMPDSMDRLVKGLTKMEPELLDELGAMTKLTEASKAYALQNGKTETSLSTLEKRTAFSNAILAELELKFGGIADESGSVARSYDRLAAAFQDVTKYLLNFISAGLAPLLEFLANNKAAIVGLGFVFLSTIKGQIVPGINQLAISQAKAAQAQAEASKKDIDSINKLSSGKRKAYNELVESIKAGTQTEAQYNAASVELAERKEAVLKRVYKDQARGEKLRATQLKNIADSEEALSKAQSAGAKARREQAIAAGIAASEDTNAFNVVGKLKDALGETRNALKANSEAKKLAGKEASGLVAGFKHLGSQAAITGKIMGTALLNALPAIGQILMAISLLIEIFEALKSSQRKALEAAAKNLDEVVKTTNDTVKELKRIETSQASLSARTEKELVARSNAVSGLASAYREVVKAATDAANAEKGQATGVAGLLDSFTGGRQANRSYFLDIRQDSKVLNEAVRKDAEESGRFFGANINMLKTNQQLLNTESVRTLDALSRLVPEETFDRIIELNGGLSQVIGSSELTGKVIEELAKREGLTAQVTKDLTQSFKGADEALSEFLKSAAISTPYDNVVKSLESVTKSLVDMTLAVPDSAQWAGLLTGMGPEMERMLNSQNRQVIQQARSSDVVIQNLRAQKELVGSLTTEQQSQLDNEQKKLKALNDQLPNIIANVEQEKARFILAQAQTREMQSQIGVIQAIMSKNQLAYTAGAAGEMARINREEQIRNIQISTLEIQKDILKSSLDQVQATLTQLEAQRELNKEINLQASAQRVNTAQQALDAALTEARTLRVPERFITPYMENGVEKVKLPNEGTLTAEQEAARASVLLNRASLNSRKSELETDRQIVSARAEERDIQATINSLESQIAALRTQNLTAEQKRTRAALAQQEVNSRISELETQKNNQIRTNIVLTNRLTKAQKAQALTLADQVQNIQAEFTSQLATLNTQAANERESLTKSIENVVALKATASGEELAAYNALETSLTTQLNLSREIAAARRQELRTQAEINLLEAVGVKTREDQLNTLKATLDLYQRRADLAKSVSDQEMEIARNAAEINILRRGGEVDDRTSRLLDMEAANRALESAQEQHDLRLAAIDVEYKLLEAQQNTQKLNLEMQLEVLRAYYRMINQGGELTTEQNATINTLSAAVSNIKNIDFAAMRDLEVRQADNTLTLAEQAAERATLAYTNLNRVRAGESELANFQERQRVRAEQRRRVEETANRGPTQVPETGDNSISVITSRAARDAATAFTDALRVNIETGERIPAPVVPATEQPITSSILLRGVEDIAQRLFPVTSSFGMRTHPVTGRKSFHGGTDYGAPSGTPIYAPFTGEVTRASFDSLSGNTIKLADEFGQVEVAALHLNRMLVRMGETVEQGQLLGYTGNTGRSTGAHLDYRIRDLTTGEYIDPEEGITINVRQPEIIVTAQRLREASNPPAAGTPPTGPNQSAGIRGAARDADDAVTALGVTFDDILDAVNTGLARSMRQFEELSQAASERLGQDFGPQGKVLQAISAAMRTIPEDFKDLQASMEGIINATATNTADIVANTTATVEQSAALVQTNTEAVINSQQTVRTGFQKTMDSASAAFTAISGIIGAIGSILKASSDARIAGIDKEIAAEQKRDGKSAASVAKIDALEKKKDAAARKSFNTQKKLMMAQAVMSTAAGVTGALALLPNPMAIPLAVIVGAMGAAQLAIIAGTQYESSYTPKSVSAPSNLSVGKRSDTVDLAKGPNANAGGEVSYLRGSEGSGSSASNYRTVGSAYGGELMRGYGNRGFVVGEKGPEVITPETPISVTPANDTNNVAPISANINIHAIDSQGVQEVLVAQKGNIIKMLREAANASGQRFMENVNTNVYTRPNVGKL